MQKLLIAAIAALSAGTVAFAGSTPAAAQSDPTATSSNLASEVQQIRNSYAANASTDATARENLSRFDQLTLPQREAVAKAVFDPNTYRSLAGKNTSIQVSKDAPSGTISRSTTTNGIETTSAVTITKSVHRPGAGLATSGTVWDVTASYHWNQTIFGLLITRLNLNYFYQTQNGNVITVTSGSCVNSHTNYNIGVAVSDGNTQAYKFGTSGACNGFWTGNIAFKGFGIDMNKEGSIKYNGSTGVYWSQLVND